jgi:hypothetical protein
MMSQDHNIIIINREKGINRDGGAVSRQQKNHSTQKGIYLGIIILNPKPDLFDKD